MSPLQNFFFWGGLVAHISCIKYVYMLCNYKFHSVLQRFAPSSNFPSPEVDILFFRQEVKSLYYK